MRRMLLGICMISPLLWAGWTGLRIGGGTGGFQGCSVGPGRNDGIMRVYGGCNDGFMYEYGYNTASQAWDTTIMGSSQGTPPNIAFHGIGIGIGRNDDTNRVYASCWDNVLYEFSFSDSQWIQENLGTMGQVCYDAPVAKGRNDDTNRVYTGYNLGVTDELSWNGLGWTWTSVGQIGTGTTNAVHDIFIGDGRNDGKQRVYSAHCDDIDGNLSEYTWDNITKTWKGIALDPDLNMNWGVIVGDGRNDGKNRVYTACQKSGGGGVFEYTFDKGSWNKDTVSLTPSLLYGLAMGPARHDGVNRIYAGNGLGVVYEFTFEQGEWKREEIGQAERKGSWFHDVAVAAGRSDDTTRVYLGCADNYVYEFTYRPVAKVLVEPDSADSTGPGVPVNYWLTVTNLGSTVDTIDLTTKRTKATWLAEFYDTTGTNLLPDTDGDSIPDTGPLNAGDSIRMITRISPPTNALAGTIDTTVVTGFSSLIPTVYDTATLITGIRTIAGILVEPDQIDSIFGGEAIDYRLTVTNLGNGPDLVDLSLFDTRADWSATLMDSAGTTQLTDHNSNGKVDVGPIPPNGLVWFTTRIQSPTQALAHIWDSTRVVGYSNLGSGASDAALLQTTIKPIASVVVEPDTTDSTQAGVPIRYFLNITNNGNGPDCIDITTQVEHPAWQITLFDSTGLAPLTDHNANSVVDVGTLSEFGGRTRIWVELLPPPDTPHNLWDLTRVTGRSSVITSVSDIADLRTKVLNLKVQITVEPDTTGITQPEEPITYSLRVLNQGNGIDTVDLFVAGFWNAEVLDSLNNPLPDRNGNAIPDLGPIPPGKTCRFNLKITPPAGVGYIVGTLDSAIVCAHRVVGRSFLDTLVTDSARTLTTVVPELNVHNYPNPFPQGPTTFVFSLPDDGYVTLRIFNRAGEFIKPVLKDAHYPMGIHTYLWDGKNESGKPVVPGLYVYPFTFKGDGVYTDQYKNGRTITKKAVVIP